MKNQQIFDYVKQQFQQGVAKESISSALLSQGWQQSDIDEAFSHLSNQSINVSPSASNVGDATKNGKAVAGLILGIIGIIAWIIPIIGAPIIITGLIFSIKGLKSLKRGVAITGVVLCSIGLLATIANSAIGAYQGATGQNDVVNEILN